MGEKAEISGYVARREEQGWTVYDQKTGKPVCLNDAPQVSLTREVARDIVQTLRMLKPGPDKSEPN
jgi:hypothetical protein